MELNKMKVALLNEVIITDTEKKGTIERYHDNPAEDCHCGVFRAPNKTKSYYYWRNINKDATKYPKFKNNKTLKSPNGNTSSTSKGGPHDIG